MTDSVKSRIKTYNMIFSPNTNQEDSQIAMINYLNEKVKCLEVENTDLKKEVTMRGGDKEKTEYYLRLRRELLEEIERLKNEHSSKEIQSNTELGKLQTEVSLMEIKLRNFKTDGNMKETENDIQNETVPAIKSSNSILSNSKYFQNIIDNEVVSNYSEENFFLNPLSSGKNLLNFVLTSDKNLVGKEKESIYFQSSLNVNIFQSEENQKELSNLVNQPNSPSNNLNPFLAVINDLEERIKHLEAQGKQKDEKIEQLEVTKDTLKKETDSEIERLQREMDMWKQKYIQVLTSKKSLSEDFQELYDLQSSNFKKFSEKTIFELERKILYLEKMNAKYEEDFDKLAKMTAENENIKQSEVETLKENMKNLVGHYDEVVKTYDENLKILIRQMDSYKQLYLARETEFINITNYYTETIKDYSKPISDLSSTQYKVIENNFFSQTKEIQELRKCLESLIKELAAVRSEYHYSKPEIRQKISESIIIYDENIKTINETHSILQAKLDKIIDFMNFFDTKLSYFSSLIEDNKKLQEKINDLECQLKMLDIDSRDKDNLTLKEQVFKLQKEIEVKNNLLKEYEDILPKYQKESSSAIKGKKVRENVSEEVVMKMKNEISILTNQITGLSKIKESVENFYQVELKTSMEKINSKNEKIEELRSIIKKMENDIYGKKETMYNLWMLEFKEFKDTLLTMTQIKSIIDKFRVQGEELSIHKDRVCSEELYLVRQEMKIKDDWVVQLENNFAEEKKVWTDLVENYKQTLDGKVIMLDTLINQKTNEATVLSTEKERLGAIEIAKKKLTENQIKIWNEQKEHVKNVLNDHTETKNKEISFLKDQVELLKTELDNSRKLNEKNLQTVINSIEKQMSLFKERESFTVTELVDLEEKFKIFREERERMNFLLKEEIQELKQHNILISKVKN